MLPESNTAPISSPPRLWIEAAQVFTLGEAVVAAGFTYLFPEDEEWRFSLFIDPALLPQGCAEVALYIIESDSDLIPIAVENKAHCS